VGRLPPPPPTPTPTPPPTPVPPPPSPAVSDTAASAAAGDGGSDRDLIERRLVYKRLLLDGALLKKFGRAGLPHARRVALSADCRFLTWAPAGAAPDADSRIAASEVTAVIAGPTSAVFVKNKGWFKDARLCFSVATPARTLDLEAPDAASLHAWVRALKCWKLYGATM
jgi:hypothetical protein